MRKEKVFFVHSMDIEYPGNREELIERAINQEESCVSVGGLVRRNSLQETAVCSMREDSVRENVSAAIYSTALARLVQFWRREHRGKSRASQRELSDPKAQSVNNPTETAQRSAIAVSAPARRIHTSPA